MVPIEELASVVAGKKTRQVSSSSWLRTSAVIIVAVLLSMARTAQAQIGTDICACSPATYTFQVRFDLTCPGNIQADNGILQTDCQLQNQEQPGDNEDFVPVFVSQITLFELGAEQQVIASQLYTGDFINGSTIVYTSVVGTDPNLNEQNITQGFQSTLLGRNAAEIGIENTWIILFTNECGVFPLFTVGDRIGWLELIDFTNPINRYCPGVPSPSPSSRPTISEQPSNFPSFSPTDHPSEVPSFLPTEHPSESPSFTPTSLPSFSPSALPSVFPSANPTPTAPTTSRPTEQPSDFPSAAPSGSDNKPTNKPIQTDEPTGKPTEKPTPESCPPVSKGKGKGKGKGGKKSDSGKGGKGKKSKSGKGGKGGKGDKGESSKSGKGGKGKNSKSDKYDDEPTKSPGHSKKSDSAPKIYKKKKENQDDRGKRLKLSSDDYNQDSKSGSSSSDKGHSPAPDSFSDVLCPSPVITKKKRKSMTKTFAKSEGKGKGKGGKGKGKGSMKMVSDGSGKESKGISKGKGDYESTGKPNAMPPPVSKGKGASRAPGKSGKKDSSGKGFSMSPKSPYVKNTKASIKDGSMEKIVKSSSDKSKGKGKGQDSGKGMGKGKGKGKGGDSDDEPSEGKKSPAPHPPTTTEAPAIFATAKPSQPKTKYIFEKPAESPNQRP